MALRVIVSLLILQCSARLIQGKASQQFATEGLLNVGKINYKGSILRVFEIDGVQVAEPRLSFENSCDPVRFNHLYQKHQLTLTIRIEANVLEASTDGSMRVGHVIPTELHIKIDDAIAGSQVSAISRLVKPDQGQLIFLCDTFDRCQQLKDDIASNSEELQLAIEFFPVSRVGGNTVRFGATRSATRPTFTCEPGQWVVFQRRVDGSLSFVQNWEAYVRGFGNPSSNYWMGLDNLFRMTATNSKNPFAESSRCRLRVETEDFVGRHYWGEYKMFQVLSPDQNYRLRVGLELPGSQLVGFVDMHNEMQFSTYDKDNDADRANSCVQQYGFGGWWHKTCHAGNPNGAYTTDRSIDNCPNYNVVLSSGKYVPMKTTLMKFKCD